MLHINSRDIAKFAGVSRSTVSRVVNNYDNVPDETRRRVMSVIQQYNYVPHSSARRLAGAKSKIIGLFMIDKKNDTAGKKVTMSSYFTPFMSGVIDKANRMGYHVLVYSVGKAKDFDHAKEVFYDQTVSSGIFIGQQNDDDAIREILANHYKAVLVDKKIVTGDEITSNSIIVNADNLDGAYQATKYLIGLGHTKIAHIAGYSDQLSTVERIDGYKRALEEAGIRVENSLIVRGNYLKESGYASTMQLLEKERPTAIFYASDSMAVGGLAALKELRLKVPDDISVVGFDDIEMSQYLSVPLTSVRIPLDKMASIAVDCLISSLESETDFSANYTVPVELVIRDSCRMPH